MPLKKYSILSIVLITFSVLVAAMSNLGGSISSLHYLLIASPDANGLAEITNGQIWRLVTPIFIHFGVLHLLFNMLWLWDLGKVIETVKGIGFYALFVLVTGIGSNLTQFMMTGSPYFGGMSGVLYGLFGYLWMLGRTNPKVGFTLNQNVVVMMLVWFVLCWTGLLGPIANWAHTAGLVIGVFWGYSGKLLR